jgi:hypothetical protein
MNAWGSSTGYADELKNKGFEDVSGITGQDMVSLPQLLCLLALYSTHRLTRSFDNYSWR